VGRKIKSASSPEQPRASARRSALSGDHRLHDRESPWGNEEDKIQVISNTKLITYNGEKG
jgi:hypothetical protein